MSNLYQHIAKHGRGRWAVTGLWLLFLTWAPYRVAATTYYVDGACSSGSSGNGSGLTCGANGPFRTISEGISALQPGDTLNVRGPHAGFDGVYNEYVGIWGTANDAFPGKALNCSAASPCVIQGCPASVCGSDEMPIVRGMVRRTDWTSEGNGVWSRAMEADTAEYIYENARDAYDPMIVMQGAAQTHLSYAGDNVAAAALAASDGQWSYNTTSHRVYVNPSGNGDPNSDTIIWIPNQRGLLVVEGRDSYCPAPSCPTSNYITLRRLQFEGSRWQGVLLYPSVQGGALGSITLDKINIRHVPRFGLNAFRVSNFNITDLDIQYVGRGVSNFPIDAGGGFAWRCAIVDGGSVTNITTKHIGNAGRDRVTGDNAGWECQWCDAPWNSKAASAITSNGSGLDLKQSRNVTVRNHTCEDASFFCFQFDVSHDVMLDGFNYRGARTGVMIREFTPTAEQPRNYNIVIRNGRIDDAGAPDNGPIYQATMSPLSPGEFGFKLYNVNISRFDQAAITLERSDKVSIWHNTIWQDRAPLGYSGYGVNTSAHGIRLIGPSTNLDIRNNLIADISGDGLRVENTQTAVTSMTIDYNDYSKRATEADKWTCDWTGPGWTVAPAGAVRWGGTCYTSLAAFRQAKPAYEVHGLSVDPQFTDLNQTPPDLHLQAASGVRDIGVALSDVTSDRDGDPRPVGPACDLGADEQSSAVAPQPPTLLNVVPVN